MQTKKIEPARRNTNRRLHRAILESPFVRRLMRRRRPEHSAELARLARNKNDHLNYGKNIIRCLDLSISGRVLDPVIGDGPDTRITDSDPIIHTRGGYFCSIVTTAGNRRYFVKAVSSDSREARFWNAWREGLIRCDGKHYRIASPVQVQQRSGLAILLFKANAYKGRDRKSEYRANLALVVRAAAEFNSDHLNMDRGRFDASCICDSPPTPRYSTVKRLFSGDPARTERCMRSLSSIRGKWSRFRERLYAESACLSHMDFGPNNIVVEEDHCVIQDFGLAGLAPVGSDLHTVFRYARRLGSGWPDKAKLVESYASVFAEKGVDLDQDAVRRALDAHFSARYRNLKLQNSHRALAFEHAVRMGAGLVAPQTSSAGPDAAGAAPR